MTREEAIKCLSLEISIRSEAYCSYLAHYGKQDKGEEKFLDSLHMAISALKEQPRWISVEERLPDESMYGKEFIVAIKNRFNESHTATMRWWGEFQQAKVWRVWHDVTHWMPMPKPPEVEV